MSFDEMYNLTPRSFFNAVNGNRKKEDALSKERWVITREIVFSVLAPYLEKEVDKQEFMTFEWEKKALQKQKEIKAVQIEADLIKMNVFWDRQDNAKK